MRMNVDNAVNEIVEAMLPRGTEDKLLHICIRASYMVFPYEDRSGGNDCSDVIEPTEFIHFIFYRPSNYTKVLLSTGSWFIEECERFELVSDHDSCWRSDGVSSNLNQIHWRIIEVIEERCKELGVDPPVCLRIDQPNFCHFEKIELWSGKTDGVNYDHRKCQMVKNGDQVVFVASE